MSQNLLRLLQLCNSSFPLGAYSYSEGLETLVEEKLLTNSDSLARWLANELKFGSIVVESAVMLRSYRCYQDNDVAGLIYWNNWFTASRETKELRQQSWQMGKSLCRLLPSLVSDDSPLLETIAIFENQCNYPIAFGLLSAYWQIQPQEAILGFLHSWLSNLVSVGIKLIPLGQSEGQQLLIKLNPLLEKKSEDILQLADDELCSCSLGLSLASMKHENLYSRLFRS